MFQIHYIYQLNYLIKVNHRVVYQTRANSNGVMYDIHVDR